MKKCLIGFALFFTMLTVNAQLAVNTTEYTTAVGLRAGITSGVTVKHFLSDDRALEGIFGFWRNGVSGTFLYEIHQNAFAVPGLNWYYGGGVHVAVQTNRDYDYRNNNYYYRNRRGNFGLGVDGIFGIEYKIEPIPIAVSLDVKPFVEFDSKSNFFTAFDTGLGIKLTF